MPKKKKSPLKKIKKELWELCKQIIRKKYGNKCFTCGADNLKGANQHTAHFIPRSICGAYLRYDLRNLRICCSRCNIWLGGNGALFYKNLVMTEGQEYVDKLFEDKHRIVNERRHLEECLALYRKMEADKGS